MSGREYLRLRSEPLLLTAAAGLPVSALLGLVQLALTFQFKGGDGKSLIPGLVLWAGTALVLPVALACGYAIVRLWTGLAWASTSGPQGGPVTVPDAFRAARGQCLATGSAYGLGITVLAWILVAGALRPGTDLTLQSMVIAAGPTGLLAPLALISATRISRVRARPAPPVTGGRVAALASGTMLCAVVTGWTWSDVVYNHANGLPVGRTEVVLAIVTPFLPAVLAMVITRSRARLLAPLLTGVVLYAAAADWVTQAIQAPPFGLKPLISWTVLLAPAAVALVALGVAVAGGRAMSPAAPGTQPAEGGSGTGDAAGIPPRGRPARPALIAAGAICFAVLNGYLLAPLFARSGFIAVVAASLLCVPAAATVLAATMRRALRTA